eukprot:XP_019920969.1 PREDICTED: uncharacterized protein LOC105323876 isoform X1 [Crassostrea gigas]
MQPECFDWKATDRNFLNRYIYPSGSRGANKSNMAIKCFYEFMSALNNLLYDVIIGNIPDARHPKDPDMRWSPSTANAVLTRQQARHVGKKTKPICVDSIIDSSVSPADILREQEENATLEKIRGLVGKDTDADTKVHFIKKKESDDEVEETRVKETTFPEIEDNKSDVEVEETRVKETTFPEIEDNVDTPDTEQDSFDMGDLPPPPPPLPSLNESISNDFPPPPFIEMMGNMTVDMGTPLEEGPQADEPLPSPPRLPLESVQRVPMSVSMLMLPLT